MMCLRMTHAPRGDFWWVEGKRVKTGDCWEYWKSLSLDSAQFRMKDLPGNVDIFPGIQFEDLTENFWRDGTTTLFSTTGRMLALLTRVRF